MKAMLNPPMYTLMNYLSIYLKTVQKRDEYINSKIEHLSLSNSVAINLTGRHTMRENDKTSLLTTYLKF